MAVHQGFLWHRAKRQLEPASLRLAHQKLLEQQRMCTDAPGLVVAAQREQLVAQRQQATRLQPHDRNASRGERSICRDKPVEFVAPMIDEARRKEGARAAERPAAIAGFWNVNAIAAFDQ